MYLLFTRGQNWEVAQTSLACAAELCLLETSSNLDRCSVQLLAAELAEGLPRGLADLWDRG